MGDKMLLNQTHLPASMLNKNKLKYTQLILIDFIILAPEILSPEDYYCLIFIIVI